MLLFVLIILYFSISCATDTIGHYFVCFKYSPVKNTRGNQELQLGVLHHVEAHYLKYYPLGIDHLILLDREIQIFRNIHDLLYYVNKAVKEKNDEEIENELNLLKEYRLDFKAIEKEQSYYERILSKTFVPDQKFEFRKLEYFPMSMDLDFWQTNILTLYYFQFRFDKTYKAETSIKLLWIYAQALISQGKNFHDLHEVLDGMIDNRITDTAPSKKSDINAHPNVLYLDAAIFSVIEKNQPIQADALKEIFRETCERKELKIVREEYATLIDKNLTFLNQFANLAAEVHTIEYVSTKFFAEQLSELFFLWLHFIVEKKRLYSRFKI